MPNSLIKNRTFISQIKDFSSLRFGKISPTDIDAFLDFQNKLFIFIELKHGKPDLSFGQKLAIERLCDSCQSETRNSFAIIAVHASEADIDVGSAIVKSIRFKKEWKQISGDLSVLGAITQIKARF